MPSIRKTNLNPSDKILVLVRAGQDGQNGMTGPGAFDSSDSRSINQGSARLSNRPQPVSHVSCLINNNPSKYA